MANDVRITVSVTDNASAPLRKVAQETDKLGTSAGGTGASMLSMGVGFGVVTAAITIAQSAINAVVGALASAVAMSAELARVNAQTGAVLRSTGGISGMTADAVRDLASSLETLTGVDEIAIQSAENMLLTFTNIGATTMPAATQAVLDMAVAMNGGLIPSEQELAKTSIQVGRALQDPIDGVTALRRVGVQLSDEQQELVKHLVATGRGAEAQALILKELQVEFGGSAEAASKARGGVDQARDAFEDAQRALGDRLIPAMKDTQKQMYLFAADVVTSMEGPLNGALNAIGNVETALSNLATLAKTPIIFTIGTTTIETSAAGILGKVAGFIKDAIIGPNTLAGAALAALTTAPTGNDPMDNGDNSTVIPGLAALRPNGANAFSPPSGGSAKAVVPAYVTALQDQIQAAYAQGGMKQVEVVRQSQEQMMAAVDTAAAKMSIDLGITLPDATQLMFDKMLAQQTELARAQEAIANANMLAQIDAYLKGGQAAVDIVKLQQADTAVEISKMANNIGEAFGITMPEALGIATKAAAGTAAAMLEMGKQATALAQQLWKTTGNTAQQGAMGALAFAVTARDAAANAGNLGALPALDAAVATALANANAPKMANGGIVRARPGGTMALLGEGGRDEAVIPLGGAGGMGGTVNVYLSGVITDPVATGKAVAAALNTASRTTGPLLLAGTVQP